MPQLQTMNDHLTPFMLEGGEVRGRVVRLGAVADTVLSRYNYPPAVAHLLGELLVATALLSANLGPEGIFTLQMRGKGLVPLLVLDAVHGGALRGYAEVPPESRAAIEALAQPTPTDLLGQDATLAITLDPGAGQQRYQGIVALEGDSVAEAFTNYFTHSQQLDVQVQIALHHGAQWAASGLMLERMPGVAANLDDHEGWRYARAVAATVQPGELLDPLLDAPTLLYRLFHEEGVWVYDAQPLSTGCRCSRTRIMNLLMSMTEIERADMVVDGAASVHCQFCNKSEVFTPPELGLGVVQ